ncbi:MAG TPA: hypothetical protein VMU96_09230 [Casimicrobiaceae bacterium]|nr:hypothetical protein [Casimicrobiaceae bacterium]
MIDPLFWLPSGTGQIGFINISGAASSKPEVEADIIENVATYGHQLGRISAVLNAILTDLQARKRRGDAKKAVDAFEAMNANITAVKARYLAPTQGNVDRLIEGINALKGRRPDEYERLRKELRRKLLDDGPAAAKRVPRRKAKSTRSA